MVDDCRTIVGFRTDGGSCCRHVFRSMRYKVRHAGYVYIMMYAILAFQQKQVNVFFMLPFRGLVFHANVLPYMPTLPLLAEFFRFYGQIPPFRSEFRLFRFLRYLLHVKI